MAGNTTKNKCKGQTPGHGTNAIWFNIRVARGRSRNKIAAATRRRNRQ